MIKRTVFANLTVTSLFGLLLLCACNLEPLPTEIEVNGVGGNNIVKASFTVNKNNCTAPCEIEFMNTSMGATSYTWDFGDGNISTDFNPIHTYMIPDEYIVKLTARNDGEEDTSTEPISIESLTFKKTFGGTEADEGLSVQQTIDGGYILLGSTQSEGAGGNDMYLIKTDNGGNQLWKRTFGGTDNDAGSSVRQTTDGGYILLGSTGSEGAGGLDMYLIKTDAEGNVN